MWRVRLWNCGRDPPYAETVYQSSGARYRARTLCGQSWSHAVRCAWVSVYKMPADYFYARGRPVGGAGDDSTLTDWQGQVQKSVSLSWFARAEVLWTRVIAWMDVYFDRTLGFLSSTQWWPISMMLFIEWLSRFNCLGIITLTNWNIWNVSYQLRSKLEFTCLILIIQSFSMN